MLEVGAVQGRPPPPGAASGSAGRPPPPGLPAPPRPMRRSAQSSYQTCYSNPHRRRGPPAGAPRRRAGRRGGEGQGGPGQRGAVAWCGCKTVRSCIFRSCVFRSCVFRLVFLCPSPLHYCCTPLQLIAAVRRAPGSPPPPSVAHLEALSSPPAAHAGSPARSRFSARSSHFPEVEEQQAEQQAQADAKAAAQALSRARALLFCFCFWSVEVCFWGFVTFGAAEGGTRARLPPPAF